MIDIDIFGGGFDKITKISNEIQQAMERAFKLTCRQLLTRGVELASKNARELVLGDGVYNQEFEDAVNQNKSRKITLTKSTFEGVIYNPTEDSAYAEFGTGLVGMADPHMLSTPSGWEYAMNPDRSYGMGWIYNRGGEFYHTYGLPSSQYLYTTGQQLQEEFDKLYKENLDKELAKVVL